jgi:hypothetical protein
MAFISCSPLPPIAVNPTLNSIYKAPVSVTIAGPANTASNVPANIVNAFVVPAGKWILSGSIQFNSVTAGDAINNVSFDVRKNGTTVLLTNTSGGQADDPECVNFCLPFSSDGTNTVTIIGVVTLSNNNNWNWSSGATANSKAWLTYISA